MYSLSVPSGLVDRPSPRTFIDRLLRCYRDAARAISGVVPTIGSYPSSMADLAQGYDHMANSREQAGDAAGVRLYCECARAVRDAVPAAQRRTNSSNDQLIVRSARTSVKRRGTAWLLAAVVAGAAFGGCSVPLAAPTMRDGVMVLEKEEDIPADMVLRNARYVQAPPSLNLEESRTAAAALAKSTGASHVLHRRVAFDYGGEVLVAVYETYGREPMSSGQRRANSAGEVMIVRSDRSIKGLHLVGTRKDAAGNTTGVNAQVARAWAFGKGADVVRFRHDHEWPRGMMLVLEAYRVTE